jgi:hypothetical protein
MTKEYLFKKPNMKFDQNSDKEVEKIKKSVPMSNIVVKPKEECAPSPKIKPIPSK